MAYGSCSVMCINEPSVAVLSLLCQIAFSQSALLTAVTTAEMACRVLCFTLLACPGFHCVLAVQAFETVRVVVSSAFWARPWLDLASYGTSGEGS